MGCGALVDSVGTAGGPLLKVALKTTIFASFLANVDPWIIIDIYGCITVSTLICVVKLITQTSQL